MRCLLLCLAFLFVSCKQDPLSDFSRPLQNQLQNLADSKPQYSQEDTSSPIPVSQHFARISSDQPFWQASTGIEFQAMITVDVFLDEADVTNVVLEVNDPTFEDETYSIDLLTNTHSPQNNSRNRRHYLFKWTPSLAFLKDQLERIAQIAFRLEVIGRQTLEKPATFDVFIKRGFYPPVLDVVDMPTTLQEGDEGLLVIHVWDENATEEDPPRLILNSLHPSSQIELSQIELSQTDLQSVKDLRTLLRPVSTEKIDQHRWEFSYLIASQTSNLRGVGAIVYGANISGHSSLSGSSDPQKVQLTVSNRVLQPSVVGPTIMTAIPGQTLSVFVNAFDITESGDLSGQIANLDDLPGHIQVFKEIQSGQISFAIIWQLPLGLEEVQSYQLLLEITNTGIQNDQTVQETVIHPINVNLQTHHQP